VLVGLNYSFVSIFCYVCMVSTFDFPKLQTYTMSKVVVLCLWWVKILQFVNVLLGMVSTFDFTNNGYWINSVEQSWEEHHTDCFLEGLADLDNHYRLVKLGSL
jgi:hypothetical protein